MDVPKAIASSDKEFKTTFSPCLDALAVNFAAAGCSASYSKEPVGAGSVGIECVGATTVNGWTLNPVAAVLTRTSSPDVDLPSWVMFCVDPNISLYIPRQKSAAR